MGTYADPNFDSRRPNHVAIRDEDTHQVVRWERKNPTVFEAENPSELVVQENPSEPNQHSKTMERENAATEIANEFLEKAKPGLGIVAGNAVAAELFDYIDRAPLSAQSTTVRKTVRIFGPGLLGVVVGRLSDNELVRSFALGHVTESVRAGVEETLAFVSNGEMGESKGESGSGNGSSQPESGTEGYRPALSGREAGSAAVNRNGELAGNFSSESGQLETSGTEETVM